MKKNTLIDHVRQEMEAYNNTIVGTQAKYGAEEATKKATELLATALEEQREEATLTLMNSTKPFFDAGYEAGKKDERANVLAEVESWLEDEKPVTIKVPHSSHKKGYCIGVGDTGVFTRNQLRAELRAKLAQMKGEE